MYQNQEKDTGKHKTGSIHDKDVKEQEQKDTDEEHKPFFKVYAVIFYTAVSDHAFNKNESG